MGKTVRNFLKFGLFLILLAGLAPNLAKGWSSILIWAVVLVPYGLALFGSVGRTSGHLLAICGFFFVLSGAGLLAVTPTLYDWVPFLVAMMFGVGLLVIFYILSLKPQQTRSQ